MRIEINLTGEVATALQAKAEALPIAENLTLNFFVLKKRWQKKLKRKRLPAPNFLRSGKVAMEDNVLAICVCCRCREHN